MKLRKEEIYILYQKHIHRLTYRAVTKTDQKSALSLLGRLQSAKFCFRAIRRIFYISALAGKYQSPTPKAFNFENCEGRRGYQD